MRTSIEITGRTNRTVVTKTIYKNTKRIMTIYPDNTIEVVFYRNDMILLCKSF